MGVQCPAPNADNLEEPSLVPAQVVSRINVTHITISQHRKIFYPEWDKRRWGLVKNNTVGQLSATKKKVKLFILEETDPQEGGYCIKIPDHQCIYRVILFFKVPVNPGTVSCYR